MVSTFKVRLLDELASLEVILLERRRPRRLKLLQPQEVPKVGKGVEKRV